MGWGEGVAGFARVYNAHAYTLRKAQAWRGTAQSSSASSNALRKYAADRLAMLVKLLALAWSANIKLGGETKKKREDRQR